MRIVGPHLVFKTGGAFNEGYFTAARREWGQAFGYEVLTTAILDRLLHHCEVVPINKQLPAQEPPPAIERDTDMA